MNAKDVDMDQCEVPYCLIKFIDNKDDMRGHFHSADAVIFQGGRMPYEPPKRHHPNQVYIFASIESPVHLAFNAGGQGWENQVNWTMTYRLDSDILYRYGAVMYRNNASKQEALAKNFAHVFRQKTKDVAWLVSDCLTESHREKYVNVLKKYIDIDIYGRCGKLHTCTKEEGIDCMKQIAGKYKFYLSFENSMCMDYITEKVFVWFQMDIINVVRGAQTYARSLPPHTYIDAHKFSGIEHLAKYLKYLSRNEEKYVQYLEEKAKYRTETLHAQYRKAYCDVCKRLHNLDKYRKTYKNIKAWWYKDKCQRTVTDIHP